MRAAAAARNFFTALHWAANKGQDQIVSLLLQADVNPTLRTRDGISPLDAAQAFSYHVCVALLEPAMVEPQRPRTLLKARALLDTAYAVRKARSDAHDKEGLRTEAAINRRAGAAAPVYLKQRVEEGRELPAVQVGGEGHGQAPDEELVACFKYALGLNGWGGVVLEGQQEPAVGMLPEVCVELCEMLVPKWARADM